MKIHTTLCRITCPHCSGKYLIPDWQPGYCKHCGADLGGASEKRLQAEELTYTLVVHPLTGEASAYWEAS